MKEQHHVSDITKHKVETVRDWFFPALGFSLIGAGLWNMTLNTQTIAWLWNVTSLIGSGLVVTLVAIALLIRLKQRRISQAKISKSHR